MSRLTSLAMTSDDRDDDDTLFYAGLGAVALLVLGGVYALTRPARPLALNALEAAGIDCYEIQGWLFDYLKQDVDPYDFQYAIIRWAEDTLEEVDAKDRAIDDDTQYDDLSKEQQDDFVRWLKNEVPDFMSKHPFDAPAYLTLHAIRKLPAGTILVHFTGSRFDAFDRGSTIEGMHLSVYKSKEFADCEINLSKDVGLAEVVFGFALKAPDAARYARAYAKKYGENVVIFRCDCAVLAYHDGDDEYQAIFPICGEYDVVSLAGDGYGGFTLGSVVDGEDVEFPSLAAALAWYEEGR